ncbi:serine/threonine-protein kinase [Streptomyces sp. NPDC005476]|uniref:serine/threonine-protein kinase n=1 Tax=Streptomyces sp. NPDC005476 TaxID=3156882 RepID=UPI003456AD31
MRLRESALALASRCSADILAGRYRLDARIGSGGAADVYRGFDLRLRRTVAVKVFRPGTGVEAQEDFESEAVILARMQHPGLVTAYDTGRHDSRAYLVMQLIEGSTLKARITEGPLPCEETATLGAGLARALAHAHGAGIVHRDVKPSNILLDVSGRPYLTDFGISRLVDATTRTATGTLVGTAAYLSPEQVLGRSVGRPADIYALGLVLLECLTGRLEYGGGPLEAAIARLHRPPVLPTALPDELGALLRDMTALDEQIRPSASDCARTLDTLAHTTHSAPAVLTPPRADVTAMVRSGEPAHHDDVTHLDAARAPDRAAPKAAPARSRVLVTGGTVALVTAMAAALAVTDVFPHQGNDGNTTRAVSRPAENAGPDDSSAGRSAAPAPPETPPTPTPTPTPSPTPARGSSGGLFRNAASEWGVRPTPGSASPNPVEVAGASRDNRSDSGAQAGTKSATPGKQSSRSEKDDRAEKAQAKSKKKEQDEPGKSG